jgi:hypothetical protein
VGRVSGRVEWVLLAYRVPREPSTPRIAVWRKLRRLGAAQVVDGLVALPADARTREQLEWLADEVLEAGGEASVWLGRLGSAAQERGLATRMADAVAVDYDRVTAAALAAAGLPVGSRRRAVTRLRREVHRIGHRDFFPPPQRDTARTAVDDLAATLQPDAELPSRTRAEPPPRAPAEPVRSDR